MCAIASTTCFLTFFFFGSAKPNSSINYSTSTMNKTVVIAHSQISLRRRLATQSAINQSRTTNADQPFFSPDTITKTVVIAHSQIFLRRRLATRSAINQSRSTPFNVVSLSLNRPPRPLPGPRIRPRTLPTNRQASSMPDTSVATQIHQALDVHRNIATQIAFHFVLGNCGSKVCNFRLGQILDRCLRCNSSLAANLLSAGSSNTVDRRQCNHDVFVQRYVYSCYTCHLSFLIFNPDAACDERQCKSLVQRRCDE